MTGRIRSLDWAGGSGVISAENGLAVSFPFSAVLAFDVPCLLVGRLVSFDLDGGRTPRAFNVQVHRMPQAAEAGEKRADVTAHLRYMGFEHRGNTRAYRFERHVPGAETQTLTVDVDLALFARHRVRIQDGPAMCLRLLARELNAVGSDAIRPRACSLSDREMLAYVASLPVARARPGARRSLAAAGGGSHAR